MRRLVLLLIVLMPATAIAQTSAAKPAAPAAPASPSDAPTPPPNYAYAEDGRRDPFLSLVNRGSELRQPQQGLNRTRPDGVPGLLIDEVSIRGVLQSRDGWRAMVVAPNGRGYTIRPGDRLLDGSVRAITGEAVIFMQEVNDPLSLEKQREVRKPLRPEVK